MKYTVLAILICLGLGSVTYAQDTTEGCSDKMIFVKAERMPVYKKSMDSLRTFFSKLTASKFTADNVTGFILLDLTICSDGEPYYDTLVNKTDWPFDVEIFREAVNSMGLWAPGFQNGRDVSCKVSLELEVEYGTLVKFRYLNNSL
jgi:hypothetical protein